MLTDDKIRAGENIDLDQNINTRDQNRAAVTLGIIFVLIMSALITIGMSHMPSSNIGDNPKQDAYPPVGAPESSTTKKSGSQMSHSETFDVRRPVGTVELPGTIGGANTPADLQPGKANTDIQKSPATSPETASDNMQSQHSH